MENSTLQFNSEMAIAVTILLLSYGLIFSERLHRTSAAILGAVSMIGVGMIMGFYSQEAAIQSIDANTLFLLAAMMMVVAMLRPTGLFEYTAIIISRLSKGSPRRLLILLSLAVSLISMVLDNVTTVIIFAPLTVLITRILKLNPMPYLMAEAMLSNVGGIATLVGDPPNIMIGSAANIDFTQFLIHMGPPIVVIWSGSVALLLFSFRKLLPASVDHFSEQHLNLDQAIQDRSTLTKMLITLALIIGLFFIHHHPHLPPAYVAFLGLTLALVLVRPKPEELFGEVNWSVLIFFAGLFAIVGGVESSGFLDLLGHQLAAVSHDPNQLMMVGLALIWVSAILSAIVDNIPFTVTMIPIIVGLESSGVNITPLWWALALGVGLGGNGTHIGATANLIAVAESEKSGVEGARITPLEWMKVGLPTMFTGLILASLLYTLFFDFFS